MSEDINFKLLLIGVNYFIRHIRSQFKGSDSLRINMTVLSWAIHTHAYHCSNKYMCLPLFPMVLWTNRFSFCLRVHIRERSVQSYPF